MKPLKFALSLSLALVMTAGAFTHAAAQSEESVTITIDRSTMPNSLLYPGRFFTEPETVTVHNYVIRDYLGVPIEGFTIQTVSGQTKVPVNLVSEIRFDGWIHRETRDIDFVHFVEWGDMTLVDGAEMRVLFNADFGTIEGHTEDGEFFLGDPHTVRRIVFHR